MSVVRRTVWFSGRVQGVFFRATAVEIAGRYPVTGTVRNLRDGRVEVIVEGAADAIDAFLGAVREAKSENITGVDVEESEASGEFGDFRVA
jgi:acylphosphatase